MDFQSGFKIIPSYWSSHESIYYSAAITHCGDITYICTLEGLPSALSKYLFLF